jgi:ABC-type transport system substrate-binding protein
LKASAAGAVGAGAFVAVGCGDDDDDDEPEPTAAPATEAPATEAPATEAPAAMGPTDGSFFSQQTSIAGTTLDLHRELYRSNVYSSGQAYNNLLKFTDMDNFVISGEIARGLPEQPDEVTYNFTIRDDVNYHNKPPANGRAMTMDDVRWNIERQRTSSRADGTEDTTFFRHPLIYKNIESVDYVDDTNLTIKMASPQVTWLGDMTDEFNSILYPEIGEKLEDENEFGVFNADNVLGTGPFIFDQFELQDRAHAVRNDDYFLRKDGTIPGMVDELFMTNIGGGEINPQRLAFEQKQIDELASRQRDVMDEIAANNPEAEAFRIGDPNNNLEFAYNYTTNRALSDERIRTAMFLATDRALVAETHFQGLARPNPAVNWPFTAWALSQEELSQAPGYRQPKDEDIKDARALWEAAGADDHDPDDFKVTIVDSPDRLALIEWFPAMLNTNLDTDRWNGWAIPITSLLEYNNSGQASVGYLGGWDQWNSPDPRTRFAQVYSAHPEDGGRGTINFWKYTTPTMEGYINDMFTEFDNERAQEIVKEAQRFALSDAGSGHLQLVGGLTSWVKWPYLHRKGPFFITYGTTISQELWIDQTDPTYQGKQRPA